MYGGFIILLGFSWGEYGSPISMINQLPETHIDPFGGMSVQYIFVWFFIAMWTFVDPGFYQRCAAANSPITAKKGVLISLVFWFIFDLLTITTGLYSKFALEISTPLFAFPLLGMEILPPIIFGLFIVGLLATIMSTVDSLGFISAITFGRDIMWRIQVTEAGEKFSMDRTITPMVQKGLFVMAFLALALAMTIPSVVRLWYVTGSIIVPGLLLPFLMTFRTHYGNPVNIIQLMTLPVMTAIIWFILGNLNGGYPFELEPFYPGLLTSLIIFSLGGLNGSRDQTKISG
jgi:SSS family solute:Na+ symporter